MSNRTIPFIKTSKINKGSTASSSADSLHARHTHHDSTQDIVSDRKVIACPPKRAFEEAKCLRGLVLVKCNLQFMSE